VRPADSKAFPAATDWEKERAKMKAVCRHCHSGTWTDDQFLNLDAVVRLYNETYFDPIQALVDGRFSGC
jgi:hydroxylamine dehydrogenase